jgi:hypothetical protein
VAVIYRDLRGTQSLDKPSDQIVDLVLFLLGHKVSELRSKELRSELGKSQKACKLRLTHLEQERRGECGEDKVAWERVTIYMSTDQNGAYHPANNA